MIMLLATVVVAGTPASARAPVPARASDPAALAAATTLVQLLDIRGALLQQGAQNVAAMRSGVAIRAMLGQQPGFAQAYQANRGKFDPVLKKVGAIQAEIADKVIRDKTGSVVAEATRAYARNYSAAELNALANFYRSPLGQAFRAREPRVSGEIGAASARLITARIDAAMQANSKRLLAALAPLTAGPAAPPPPR